MLSVIELDGQNWKRPADFYDDLLSKLKAPDWHGRSLDALVDSVVYGGTNEINPPLRIQVSNFRLVPDEVQKEICLVDTALREAADDQEGEMHIEFLYPPC